VSVDMISSTNHHHHLVRPLTVLAALFSISILVTASVVPFMGVSATTTADDDVMGLDALQRELGERGGGG
jgi:hypothetical protein